MRGSPVVLGQYDHAKQSMVGATDTGRESLVQQQFRDEVDINTIVRRFGITGDVPTGVPAGIYADLTGLSDLQSAVELVDRVRERFAMVPADVRDRFGNDPVRFAAAVQQLTDEQLVAEAIVPKPAEAIVPKPAEAVKPVENPPAEGSAG